MTALLVAAAVIATGYVGLIVHLSTCSGDGGAPYSARSSPAGQWCESDNPFQLLWIAMLLGPMAAAVTGGMLAFSRRRFLGAGLAAAIAVLVLLLWPTLLRDECTDAERAAGMDCETY